MLYLLLIYAYIIFELPHILSQYNEQVKNTEKETSEKTA